NLAIPGQTQALIGAASSSRIQRPQLRIHDPTVHLNLINPAKVINDRDTIDRLVNPGLLVIPELTATESVNSSRGSRDRQGHLGVIKRVFDTNISAQVLDRRIVWFPRHKNPLMERTDRGNAPVGPGL